MHLGIAHSEGELTGNEIGHFDFDHFRLLARSALLQTEGAASDTRQSFTSIRGEIRTDFVDRRQLLADSLDASDLLHHLLLLVPLLQDVHVLPSRAGGLRIDRRACRLLIFVVRI